MRPLQDRVTFLACQNAVFFEEKVYIISDAKKFEKSDPPDEQVRLRRVVVLHLVNFQSDQAAASRRGALTSCRDSMISLIDPTALVS